MTRRLVLLSGISGDGRLFSTLNIPQANVLTPSHVYPQRGETLVDYAERVADAHEIGPDDVIGGASYGGMLAGQIASRRKVAGLIVLGSCLKPAKLPRSYHWMERVGRALPNPILMMRTWGPVMKLGLSPMTDEGQAILRAMARDFNPRVLRRFGRMIVQWPGVETPACPTLVLHGDKDVVIPPRCAQPHRVIKNAGHCFTLTHAEETSAAIAAFLAGLA